MSFRLPDHENGPCSRHESPAHNAVLPRYVQQPFAPPDAGVAYALSSPAGHVRLQYRFSVTVLSYPNRFHPQQSPPDACGWLQQYHAVYRLPADQGNAIEEYSADVTVPVHVLFQVPARLTLKQRLAY